MRLVVVAIATVQSAKTACYAFVSVYSFFSCMQLVFGYFGFFPLMQIHFIQKKQIGFPIRACEDLVHALHALLPTAEDIMVKVTGDLSKHLKEN